MVLGRGRWIINSGIKEIHNEGTRNGEDFGSNAGAE
jgi:hypothetical protein